MAESDPARETALLKPEAVDACWESTDVRTSVVMGASARLIPMAIRRTAGNISVQYCASTPILVAHKQPRPATTAPATSGSLRPKRVQRMLAIGDTTVIKICSGMNARPARSELRFAPLIITNGINVRFAANAP